MGRWFQTDWNFNFAATDILAPDISAKLVWLAIPAKVALAHRLHFLATAAGIVKTRSGANQKWFSQSWCANNLLMEWETWFCFLNLWRVNDGGGWAFWGELVIFDTIWVVKSFWVVNIFRVVKKFPSCKKVPSCGTGWLGRWLAGSLVDRGDQVIFLWRF